MRKEDDGADLDDDNCVQCACQFAQMAFFFADGGRVDSKKQQLRLFSIRQILLTHSTALSLEYRGKHMHYKFTFPVVCTLNIPLDITIIYSS